MRAVDDWKQDPSTLDDLRRAHLVALASRPGLRPGEGERIATVERLEALDNVCMMLARYGRQPLEWLWLLPVPELQAQFSRLKYVVELENKK